MKYIHNKGHDIKDRLILAILLVGLWITLFIFQKYVPIQSALYVFFVIMFAYGLLIQAAQSHQKRKIKKLIKKGVYIEKNFANSNYEPFVSIIIPCHDEENVITETLNNITQVDYKNYEILVVDDRSTDKTPEVIKNYSNENSKVQYYIRNKNAFPGKSAVLNEALSMTQGDVLCVFDADARIEKDFLKKIVPYLADNEVGAVQARKVINNRSKNFFTRCQDNEYILDTHFQSGRDSIEGAVELRGNGQLVKREALEDVDGWNNFSITDDIDLSTKLHLKGWDVRLAKEVCVYEEGITSVLPIYRQRRRWIEGSIRRYLDHFMDIMKSPKASLRVKADMFAYITEFALPVGILSEYLIQGIRIVKGVEDGLLYTFLTVPILSMYFAIGLLVSINKYRKTSLLSAIKQSIETGIYLVAIWVPVVFYIVFKIILCKRSMDWTKTEHGDSVVSHAS